ncbi:tRNA1(Val) (adenine(37)-N6)-methyltransferase [Selenomonadales bacterium OttesenSCG-928-I06]|nr:tRNA1(Val) (adenine(37)-N6)-methyltransferase [Selenomonadales bacterium OttesenSCG-928-I06]
MTKDLNIKLNPGERIDDLILKDFKIIQNKNEFCFALDAILLANFVKIKRNSEIIDLGTGTGVIPIILAARGAQKILGIDINKSLIDMAKRSVKLNNLSDKVDFVNADLRTIKEVLPANCTDIIVTNPPYYKVNSGFLNSNENIAIARHEIKITLSEIIENASYLIKNGGSFFMIHIPERIDEIIFKLNELKLYPRNIQFVYPNIKKSPNMLLIEAISGEKKQINILPPLIVYDTNGEYTEDIKKLFQK